MDEGHASFFQTLDLRALLGIFFGEGVDASLGSGTSQFASLHDDILEALLKPVESHEYNEGVYHNGVTQHSAKVEEGLLASSEQIDINGIQATLGGGARGEEQGIDVCNTTNSVDDDGD